MPEPLSLQGERLPPAVCVIDTHVVLEAFWFDDARVRPIVLGLAAQHLAWRTSTPMRAELAAVLPRLESIGKRVQREHVLTSFDRWAVLEERTPAPTPMRCDDPNDQMFVDLAVAVGARWLFTRDKALLRLARRLAARGCEVVPPERYRHITA